MGLEDLVRQFLDLNVSGLSDLFGRHWVDNTGFLVMRCGGMKRHFDFNIDFLGSRVWVVRVGNCVSLWVWVFVPTVGARGKNDVEFLERLQGAWLVSSTMAWLSPRVLEADL